jgi:RES domain-containing protein
LAALKTAFTPSVVIHAWRIVKARHAGTAFDGEGPRVRGGRWNSPGTAVVYTSQSNSLAVLETLVHFDRESPLPQLVVISCRFPDHLMSEIDGSALPEHWRSYPAPPELQQIGDEWIKSRRSAVLAVPSAIIESERNYLLNPQHSAFGSIEIGAPQPFAFDLRLLRKAVSARPARKPRR